MMMYFFQVAVRRISSSKIDVVREMIRLNTLRKHEQVIKLFNEYIEGQSPNSMMLDQTLKACVKSSNFVQATQVVRHISPSMMQNEHTASYLIRLHSSLIFIEIVS
jgi:hypothetical protein